MKSIYTLFILISIIGYVNAATVITYGTGDNTQPENIYDYNLLKLALEKTKPTYGNYELQLRPGKPPTYSRLRIEVENNKFENLVYKESASNDVLASMAAIQFPIDLGAAGYRVGFISEQSKEKINSILHSGNITDLSIIQGKGWLDGDILKSQGFKVYGGRSIEGLFLMAANHRADMFPLGSHELKREWDKYKHIDGLQYDDKICIYYPLPKFFVTNVNNSQLSKRIYTGLKLAYDSGELMELWKHYYLEKVQFSKLNERKIFTFSNPMISDIDPSYKNYILDPKIL